MKRLARGFCLSSLRRSLVEAGFQCQTNHNRIREDSKKAHGGHEPRPGLCSRGHAKPEYGLVLGKQAWGLPGSCSPWQKSGHTDETVLMVRASHGQRKRPLPPSKSRRMVAKKAWRQSPRVRRSRGTTGARCPCSACTAPRW